MTCLYFGLVYVPTGIIFLTCLYFGLSYVLKDIHIFEDVCISASFKSRRVFFFLLCLHFGLIVIPTGIINLCDMFIFWPYLCPDRNNQFWYLYCGLIYIPTDIIDMFIFWFIYVPTGIIFCMFYISALLMSRRILLFLTICIFYRPISSSTVYIYSFAFGTNSYWS